MASGAMQWKARIAAGCLALLAGCAGMPGSDAPFDVVLDAERVAGLLGGRLAINRKFLDLLELNVGQPKIAFDAQTRRLRAGMDAMLRHPFSSTPLKGTATLSGGLSFDEKTMTVMLLEPRIEALDFDGVPPMLRDSMTRLASLLGAEYLKSYPIYTVKPEDLRRGGREFSIKGLEIVGDSLKVVLAPKP